MAKVALGLIVLRASDLQHTLAFYALLGLDFVPEKHGNGPTHYACTLTESGQAPTSGLVIEIYLGQAGVAPTPKTAGATMLGFQVASLDQTLAQLTNFGAVLLSPLHSTTNYGCRAVVQDPDGRAIELTEFGST